MSWLLQSSQGLSLCVYLYIVAICGHRCIYSCKCIYLSFKHSNLPCATHWTKCLSTQQSGCYHHHPHFPRKKTEVQGVKVTCPISPSPASGEARVGLWRSVLFIMTPTLESCLDDSQAVASGKTLPSTQTINPFTVDTGRAQMGWGGGGETDGS